MFRRLKAFALAAVAGVLLLGPALALGVDDRLPDPAQEQRAHALSRELRCLVCQNQSIEDSNAPLAKDLRQIVRERIVAGDTDAAVKQYVVARYGDWVLLQPPFKMTTLLLWIGPAILFLIAAGGLALYYRRSRPAIAAMPVATPLDAAEQVRVKKLLDEANS
jgi:cytochrome c-type biogenesis protein CcmH